MEQNVIVLGVSKYNFTQRDTGEIIQGTKVHYVNAAEQKEDNTLGKIPQTANMAYEIFSKFLDINYPSNFLMKMSIKMSGKSPKLIVEDFIHQSNVVTK